MYANRIAALAGGLALLTFPAVSPAAEKDDCQYRYRYGYGRYSPVRYYGGYYPGRYYGYGARVHGAPLIGAGFGVGYPRYGSRYGRYYNPGPRVGSRIGFGSGSPGYYGRPYRYAGYGYPGYWGGGYRRAYYPAATAYRRSYYGGPAYRRSYYPVAGQRRAYRSGR